MYFEYFYFQLIIEIGHPVAPGGVNIQYQVAPSAPPSAPIITQENNMPPPPPYYARPATGYCSYCGVPRQDSMAKFCSSCGQPLSTL